MSVRALLAIVALAGVYLLALASIDPFDVAAGLVVGALVVAGFRGFLFPDGVRPLERPLARAAASVPLTLVVLRDIVVGTWEVALIVLHLRPLASPGIVAVPVGERTETGIAVSALLATLSPGEFLVDVDRERDVLLFHVIDASDPEAVRRRHDHFYRRWQRPVFP